MENSAMCEDLPEPYRRLLRAVLTGATKDYYAWHNRAYDGFGKNRARDNAKISSEALAWFIPDKDEETAWPFSFHAICEAVGLNEKVILNEILAKEANDSN